MKITPMAGKPLNNLLFAINHYVSTGDHIGEGMAFDEGPDTMVSIPYDPNSPVDTNDFRLLTVRLKEIEAEGGPKVTFRDMGIAGKWQLMVMRVRITDVPALAEKLMEKPSAEGWGTCRDAIVGARRDGLNLGSSPTPAKVEADLPSDTKERLAHRLRTLAKEYPGLWQSYENAYSQRDSIGWPGWVFVPMEFAKNISKDRSEQARIHSLAAWRLSQDIYTFEPELFDALIETEMGNAPLPVDVLLRIPAWCFYIDFGGRIPYWHGVYVSLDYNGDSGHRELSLLFDAASGEFIAVPVALIPDGSILDAVAYAIEHHIAELFKVPGIGRNLNIEIQNINSPHGEGPDLPLSEVVNLVLYLCSQKPDVSPPPPATIQRPEPVKVKKQLKFFPPPNPRLHRVGEPLAAQLAEARERAMAAREPSSKERAPITPHIRKPHWHGFWSGPRTAESRNFDLKWMPPIPVAPRVREG
jgi:hypothetical protein